MRAAIYARISEDRDGTALGVARQLEDCRAYAKRRGWTAVAEYVDNNVSATSGKRPEYLRLLADIQAGALDAVVVWALDRLHRRPVELEEFIDLADRHRLALGSVGGDVDLATSSGRLHARLMGVVARHEAEQRAERVRRAALQRAQAGKNHGSRRAFGHSKDGLSLEPGEAVEVARAYKDLLAGVPLGAICRDFNARGIPTVRGGQWAPGTLRDMLLRPRHAGLREYRGEVIGKGQWPPIVSEQVWRAAVALLKDPERRMSTGNRASYLLSGLALCGVCGKPLMSGGVKRSTGGTRKIYKCRRGIHVGRRQDWIDDFVSRVIVERLSRPDAGELLIDDTRPDIDALRAESEAIHVRLDEAAAAFAEGVITASQMRTATERLRARLSEVEAVQAHTSRTPVLADLIRSQDVRATWDNLDLDRRRAVVASLIEVTIHPGGGGRREFDPSKVEITWKI